MGSKKKLLQPDQRSFAISSLRRGSYKWGPRYKAKVAARVSRGQYLCAKCGELFRVKEVQMDHIQPVIAIDKTKNTLDEIAGRMLVYENGWQVLCKPCHKLKSKTENKRRKR